MNQERRRRHPQSEIRSGKGKDHLSRERRSWNMSRIRGKNTTPEMRVRSMLHRLGFRFRLHVRIPITHSASIDESDAVLRSREREKVAEGRMRAVGVKTNSALRCRKKAATPSTLDPRPSTRRTVSVDIVLLKHRTAIFVHGCFWHRHRGCKNCTTPTNRREWWLAKLEGNAARDTLHQAALKKLGWRVIVIWECEAERDSCVRILRRQFSRGTGA